MDSLLFAIIESERAIDEKFEAMSAEDLAPLVEVLNDDGRVSVLFPDGSYRRSGA